MSNIIELSGNPTLFREVSDACKEICNNADNFLITAPPLICYAPHRVFRIFTAELAAHLELHSDCQDEIRQKELFWYAWNLTIQPADIETTIIKIRHEREVETLK